jgi:hypothetical protein
VSEVRTPPRRLVELHPKWKMTTDGSVYGIEYDCPCGLCSYDPDNGINYEKCCPSGGRQIVPTKTNFAGLLTCADSARRGWDLTGDSFETITLSPSIHQVGHWHGFLRAGWVESC